MRRGASISGKRYETFVIRLWVETDDRLDHGEICHVGSNAGMRFRNLDEAMAFINRVIAGNVRSADNRRLTADC